jgi:hypothetical protein
MATFASNTGGGKDFDPVPEGSHLAVCDMFVDLGLQDSRFGAKHKIYIRWQIPSLRAEWEKDGVKHEGPMAIGATYTLSLSEKSNLRPMLQSWRGRAFTPGELKKFDVTTILGAPCMITVTHQPKEGGGVYANVGVVAKLPSGVPAPTLEGEKIIYDADNVDSWDKLRPWMQEKIRAQIVEEERPEPRPFSDELEEDFIPF